MGHTVGFSLKHMVRQCERLHAIQRSRIRDGDTVHFRTINSVYQIRVEEDRMFLVIPKEKNN